MKFLGQQQALNLHLHDYVIHFTREVIQSVLSDILGVLSL